MIKITSKLLDVGQYDSSSRLSYSVLRLHQMQRSCNVTLQWCRSIHYSGSGPRLKHSLNHFLDHVVLAPTAIDTKTTLLFCFRLLFSRPACCPQVTLVVCSHSKQEPMWTDVASFLQARCPSCYLTNSVKALKVHGKCHTKFHWNPSTSILTILMTHTHTTHTSWLDQYLLNQNHYALFHGKCHTWQPLANNNVNHGLQLSVRGTRTGTFHKMANPSCKISQNNSGVNHNPLQTPKI